MDSDEDHFTYAMQLVTSASLTMVLESAIKLNIFETIAESGPDARLSPHEIVSRLSIPNQDAPMMVDRMLKLLASHSIVTCSQGEYDSKQTRVYGLAPVAKYFVRNKDGVSLGTLIELHLDKISIESWFKLNESITEGGVPFDKVFGKNAFEYQSLDVRYNDLFNNAMVNHTTIVMKKIMESYGGFQNLKRLVDVGGGIGVTLNMIVLKYPTIKAVNFDLAHVTRNAPLYPGIEHIGGDMFEEVPQGEAILMKWILHGWSDDHCVKLLKNCYKALPCDGKVIVVEAVSPLLPDTSCSVKAITQMDVVLMTKCPGGKERTEDEFRALAKTAGFSGIKKECFVCNIWVMEFYK